MGVPNLRKLPQSATKPVVVTAMAFLAIEVARRAIRRAQLFNPRREPETSWDPAAYGVARSQVEELWLETDDGEMLHSWYCRAENPVASAVFCHGNSGNLTTSAAMIPHLLSAGLNVLTFDYRGFGRSSGIPSLGGVVADGVSAARHHDEIKPEGLPSILYGFSLGGAVAAQVVQHHKFDGLILQSTFTNLRELARSVFPRVPLHLVAGDVFDTLRVIRTLDIPLLVLHGTDDETCPSWMGEDLYEACPSPKWIEIVEGGLHKDLFVRAPEKMIEALRNFSAGVRWSAPRVPAERPRQQSVFDVAFRYVRRHLRRRFEHQPL